MLPRFEVVARRRPVHLVSPDCVLVDEVAPGDASWDTPHPAPYAAVVADLDDPGGGRVELELTGADGTRFTAWYDDARGVGLHVTAGGTSTSHRSRRMGTTTAPATGLALTLTGTHLSVLTRGEAGTAAATGAAVAPGESSAGVAAEGSAGGWTVRGRYDLRDRFETRDEAWLGSLRSGTCWRGPGASPVGRLTAGGFGQLGLRDVRLASHADGSPVRIEGRLLLTATSAGPGFFDTAHTSVWTLDPATLELRHRSDLFFRRADRPGVFGDNATHLVRDGDRWRVATSTWADFDRRRNPTVGVTLAESTADLTTGRHVLDTRPLRLPTDGVRSVGVWDPHLVRTGEGWLVGFVSATRFFRFHPMLAAGPTLDQLQLRGAATDRIATEGTTLVEIDGVWRALASDGRDGRSGTRGRYPVFDLALAEVGALDAPYPSNIPWPTLVRDGDDWLLVTFDGTPQGGPLVGYGSHGDLVVARTAVRP